MLAVVREPSAADPAARFELLQKARRQYDQGAITDAWESVSGLTHAELATAYGVGSRVGRDHAETAARLARRLGMHPLGTELAAQLASSHKSEPSLTCRELEIAALVADGLSNAAIGQRLTLSERTVENHVSHILHKLGRTSRTAVASWYTSRQPP
jgi:DNA-binding NarL/FixJ family response regulator